ncbi:DUF3631 domain-containing protein [Actinokineospora iranica]|uniref:DUF3631 domain-containing protein n=1 Tax=Actinokineospora iranica TaxID=1271860 RepID=UPI0015872F72|nr:DUF3631 domain-containing protein [Actinokineospora iranica]
MLSIREVPFMEADATIATWRKAAAIVRSMRTPTPPTDDGAWNTALDQAAAALERHAAELERGDTRLLSHLQVLFNQLQTDRIATGELLRELEKRGVSPDVPLDSRRLSRELARHGIRPVTFKIGELAVKGYVTYPTKTQIGLAAAWRQYLAPLPEVASGS